MSQSPEKRYRVGTEPAKLSSSKDRSMSFDAPTPNPALTRPGRLQHAASGLSVPQAKERGRSWEGSGSGLVPPKRPSASPHAKSASPAPNRDKRTEGKPGLDRSPAPGTRTSTRSGVPAEKPTSVDKAEKSPADKSPADKSEKSPAEKAKARPLGAKGTGKNLAPLSAGKLLQAAVNLRNSRSIRLALARATQAPPALMAKANSLLERLATAEAKALQDLQSAERDDSLEPPPPWRLVCLDFDRTIAKEHMWGTYKEAPLDEIPVNEETFVNLALFRWLVRSVRKLSGEVAIASFGRPDVADKAMQFALGENHGIVITTPLDYPDPAPAPGTEAGRCPAGSSWLGDKNTQLAALARRFSVAATDMLLLDDDLHNVEEAAKAGVSAFHAPLGLNKAALQNVADLLGLTRHAEN
ncbi:unnamed protein product [Effrenium voratum]|nr:unnamed protein product [Effrenium voratum]|mmetsp:Transcript_20194/g.47799  ORF Transcript_20194/g.47799 Transcript_20194/m.47799 type:complete len:412 (+) Transcript_20194:73-1308(+)